ncbi:hypothetical protein [Mesobacillus harenae]|uniref:hypothetical protein n=1 Tax=Mesobacillus harenae TaxID=2213203 RepID=UPI001F548895|nr:hypothetical protein [Mesobacillus harenae]
MMDLSNNMEFEMKNGFLPNLSNSERLKILEVKEGIAVIQMDKSHSRGVFPTESLQYWIRRGALRLIDEHQQKSS